MGGGGHGGIFIKKGNQNIQDHQAVYADSTFFKVFTAPMIDGDPATALNEPNSIVIDETTALKYFNSTHVTGKTLYVDNSVNCKITGVIKDFPRQSHFPLPGGACTNGCKALHIEWISVGGYLPWPVQRPL